LQTVRRQLTEIDEGIVAATIAVLRFQQLRPLRRAKLHIAVV
jgi:hypothetical protein